MPFNSPFNKKSCPTHPSVPCHQLLRLASFRDKALFIISITSSFARGVIFPINTVFIGAIIDKFATIYNANTPSHGQLLLIVRASASIADRCLILAFANFFLSFIQSYTSTIATNAIGNHLRRQFFHSLISQHSLFFDHSHTGSLSQIIISDINTIEDGIQGLPKICQSLSSILSGIIIGAIYGWRLMLVMLALSPVVLISGAALSISSSKTSSAILSAYTCANTVASETLSLIRTVAAFGSHHIESRRYDLFLEKAYRSSVKSLLLSALGQGISLLFFLLTYAVGFWYGARLVRDNLMSTGDVLLTFFSITMAFCSLGCDAPIFTTLSNASVAASRVFHMIALKSPIDPTDDNDGYVPTQPIRGHISFENVNFRYEKNLSADENHDHDNSDLVLEDFNLHIPPGASEALVGISGCGKTTLTRLMQRFYDPQGGAILLDGIDIRKYNVRWLRSQIGVVAQTPTLFRMSIADNIALGAGLEVSYEKNTGKRIFERRTVTQTEIISVAKMAKAHGFISKLPGGYSTMLGERGAMLSGGQKQRICIARALIRRPKLLLLDESTASLDAISESLVQEELEIAATGRTTITIAHRLSTVRNADNISCMKNGRIIERGSHENLLMKDGYYNGLFKLSNMQREKNRPDSSCRTQSSLNTMSLRTDVTLSDQFEGSNESEGGKKEKNRGIEKGLFLKTLKLNRSQWPLLLFGILGAFVSGAVFPFTSIVLVNLVDIMLKSADRNEILNWTLVLIALAVLSFIGIVVQLGALGISGELLTKKVRSLTFRNLLRQDMGFFDLEENSLGILTGRLSADANRIKGLTGGVYGVAVSTLTSITLAMGISFWKCWRLSLVVLAILPGIVGGGFFSVKSSSAVASNVRSKGSQGNGIVTEAIDSVKTVRSLAVEDLFEGHLHEVLKETEVSRHRIAVLSALGLGFSLFCMNFIWFAVFRAGGDFVLRGQCSFTEVLYASFSIVFSATALGNSMGLAPDLVASKFGASNVYALMGRESEIDADKKEGKSMKEIQGGICAEKLYFSYPRRPHVPVLRGLTVEIAKARTLALVGASGHGKSTIISLLERFYWLRDGVISIDGQDISEVRVGDLRSHIGLVSQEAELFNRSVFDNITYGLSHSEGTGVTMSEVIEVAKQANAHDFIQELPQGYDTVVGERGEGLSGGQRQRIAIARSLIRRPKILLLDEATSALDIDSERVVQKALDEAAIGRTTIVVAHRLSTIQNADVIAVVRNGEIVESGKHDELLRRNGAYCELVEHQLTEGVSSQ